MGSEFLTKYFEGGGEIMKRKSMAVGALLLAVLVTSYSVCGTYAKYTSSIDIKDEARVAQWAFKLNGNNPEAMANIDIDLFKDSYVYGDDNHTVVVSNTPGVDVVAPGTSGEYSFRISGTAETNYTVSMNSVSIENTIKTTKLDGSIYDPIVFKLTDKNGVLATGNSEALKTALEALYSNNTVVYAANHTLDDQYTISWSWDFDDNGNGTNDELDTYLAQQNGTVKVGLNLVINQTQAKATVETNESLKASFSNKFDETDYAALVGMGYEPELSRNIKFVYNSSNNTILLSGSIQKTTKDEGFSSVASDRTGYYYPISIRVNKDSQITFSSNPTKQETATANTNFTILYALSNSGAKTSTITIGGVNYTVDYTGVTFVG